MPIGNTLLAIACATCLVSLVGYGMTLFNRESMVTLARKSYYVCSAAIVLMCAYFLMQILNHNFALEYVHSYSSRDLGLGFLISTFWAGQVGSFTLWLFFITIIGIFLIRRETENHSAVMFFYMLIITFFLTLLVARSPFTLIPAQFLAQFPGGMPPDGQGLNPLLQNYWMVIHPPIVFIGFSLLAVPFAYALGALAKNNFRDWVKNSFPWTAIASFFLGLGIFLGGYWAYETLGWGGYWAWDPVENTSLIPWMINLALMHGLLIERNKGVFRRSNLVMAIFAFLLVVYGTFLTRSGVLADFSVHSFTDLGISGYLVFFMLFFLTLSIVLLVVRAKSAKTGFGIKDPYSVDFAIAVGIFFLTLLSILTLVGTSAPLITRIFGEPANVSMDFYNKTALPMAIILALLAGISPFLVSKDRSWPTLFKRLSPALGLALVGTIVSVVFGVTQFMYLLMIFMALFALFGNIFVIFLQPGKIGLRAGGFVTHMGFGVMMVGIVASSAFSQTEMVNLYSGKAPVKSLGYDIAYSGMEGDLMNKDNAVHLKVQDGHTEYLADPKMFIAKENQGMMRKPFIRKYFFHDLYLSPQQQQTVGDGDKLILTRGEAKRIGDFDVKFTSFDMGNHSDPNTMQVGANIEVTRGGQTQVITPVMAFSQSGKKFLKADMPDGQGSVMLNDIQADAGMVSLQFAGVPGMDVVDLLVLEVSTKPLINLVWLGLIMVCGGTFVSFIRRRKMQFAAVPNYQVANESPTRSLTE